MNKSDLIDAIASSIDTTKAQAARFVDSFIDEITANLKQGAQVTLPGFGTFSVSYRAARTGRNPQTGEPIEIKAARIAKFKAGKALKEAVETENS